MLQLVVALRVEQDGHQVEAHFPVVVDLFHVEAGGRADERGLLGREERRGLAIEVGAAGLDFDEHQRVSVFSDDVDLGAAAAPVPFEDLVTFFL